MTGVIYVTTEEKKSARRKMLEAKAETLAMMKEKISQMKW